MSDIDSVVRLPEDRRKPLLHPRGNLVGRTYLERGKPVTVLTSWRPGGGPHNVEIRRADGSVVIRGFRGLRKMPEQPPA